MYVNKFRYIYKNIVSGTRVRPSKVKQQVSVDEKDDEKTEENMPETNTVELEIVDQQPKEFEENKDDVKDSWDAETSEDEHDEGIKN